MVMKRSFKATGYGKFRTRAYIITLDVENMNILFEKRTKTKTFSMLRCKSLRISTTVHRELTLHLEAMDKSPAYKKVLLFQSQENRNDFYNIYRQALQAGERAVNAFKSLDIDEDGKVPAPRNLIRSNSTSKITDIKSTNGEGKERKSDSKEEEHRVDFFEFLKIFTEALTEGQTRRKSRSSTALHSADAQTGICGEYEGRALSHISDGSHSTIDHISIKTEILDSEQGEGDAAGNSIVMLEGEGILQGNPSDITFRIFDRQNYGRGRFLLTSYRIVYLDSTNPNASFFAPHSMVKSFDIIAPAQVMIETHDYRTLHLKLISAQGPKLLQSVQKFFLNRGTKVFAFFHKQSFGGNGFDGWNLTRGTGRDAELKRFLSVSGGSAFRVYDNKNFSLCPSYPTSFVVPASVSDKQLEKVARYRSMGRIPAVVWCHPVTGATISRCAQPLTGLFGGRCREDEAMVQALADGVTEEGKKRRMTDIKNALSNPKLVNKRSGSVITTSGNSISLPNQKENTRKGLKLVIMDARPWKAAMGNSVMGKGTENAVNYSGCALHFCKIDNIHAVRGSLDSLMAMAKRLDSATWLSELEDTKWLHYQSLLLSSADKIRDLINKGVCVLVHCSDGWDRTAQLVSLALLLVDPHFRTLEGFSQLVERQWCAFGHKFAERCGHYNDSSFKENQQAPIFVQFLEAVWQICRQNPDMFEFNAHFLAAIAFHTYSCRFGTFLFNTDKMRQRYAVEKNTVSLWSYLLSPPNKQKFINHLYYVRREKKTENTDISGTISSAGPSKRNPNHKDSKDELVVESQSTNNIPSTVASLASNTVTPSARGTKIIDSKTSIETSNEIRSPAFKPDKSSRGSSLKLDSKEAKEKVIVEASTVNESSTTDSKDSKALDTIVISGSNQTLASRSGSKWSTTANGGLDVPKMSRRKLSEFKFAGILQSLRTGGMGSSSIIERKSEGQRGSSVVAKSTRAPSITEKIHDSEIIINTSPDSLAFWEAFHMRGEKGRRGEGGLAPSAEQKAIDLGSRAASMYTQLKRWVQAQGLSFSLDFSAL
mmetsp:Transcript_4294/g.6421  ORF Transcript_4294/g.6421 Transcript_4294/m.6421 type:complete len:1050 (-) Transcript_4294:88-3237(-)